MTMSALDIEKTNLEAHVELCSERYDNLSFRLDQIELKIQKVENSISDIKEMITDMHHARTDAIVSWTRLAIFSLISAIGGMAFFVMTHKVI
jgi:chromosome segregation ATPase